MLIFKFKVRLKLFAGIMVGFRLIEKILLLFVRPRIGDN